MRPFVTYNVGMSLDGRVATSSGDCKFSSEEDWEEVHGLRALSDGVMVGIGTVLTDDPRLNVRKAPLLGDPPTKIVVDSQLRIPLSARIFQSEGPVIIGCTYSAGQSKKAEMLVQQGVSIVGLGQERVDLGALMEELKQRDMAKILLEGGPTLAYSMLLEGLVDEVRVALAPVIIGDGVPLVQGLGAGTVAEGIQLQLLEQKQLGSSVVLRYRVLGS